MKLLIRLALSAFLASNTNGFNVAQNEERIEDSGGTK